MEHTSEITIAIPLILMYYCFAGACFMVPKVVGEARTVEKKYSKFRKYSILTCTLWGVGDIMLFLWLKRGQAGRNIYGPDPLR